MVTTSICNNSATRAHQQGSSELHQVPDCLHGCGCQWWSLRASAITLSISKSASCSHRQQTGSFQSHQQTRPIGEDYAWNAEKLALSRLKRRNFVICRYNSTKLGGKMYILLLNSCKKCHARIAILTKVTSFCSPFTSIVHLCENAKWSCSVNQSITDISLVDAVSHEGVNRRRRWMAVSGMTCRRSWRGVFSEKFWKCPR